MLSAVISSILSYPALQLALQPVHQWYVHPGPLVLGTAPLNSSTPMADRDRTVSRRSEPSSRTTLIGEQPNPWDLLQPQDVMSQLYKDALENNIDLPKKYSEFSFHSYDTKPLPTESLKAREILKLRDEHFHKYFSNKKFQIKIKNKFGENAVKNINNMLQIKLKRKIIEEKV